jgi:hypothetical protein
LLLREDWIILVSTGLLTDPFIRIVLLEILQRYSLRIAGILQNKDLLARLGVGLVAFLLLFELPLISVVYGIVYHHIWMIWVFSFPLALYPVWLYLDFCRGYSQWLLGPIPDNKDMEEGYFAEFRPLLQI